MKSKIFLIAFVFLFVNSCTIEKRIYNDGFYLQMKGKTEHLSHENKRTKTKEDNQQINKLTIADSPQETTRGLESLKPSIAKTTDPVASKGNKLQEHEAAVATHKVRSSANIKSEKEALIENKSKSKSGDTLIYLAAIAMSLGVIAIYKSRKKKVAKLTRWAKANPKKAQGLIAALQLALSGLALYSGYNLKQLGYELSANANYLWLCLSAAGFLTTPFLARKASITLPKTLNFNRLKYLGITMSSLMLLTNLGNTITTTNPTSFLATTLSYADQSIIRAENNQPKTVDFNKKETQNNNTRMMLGVGMCVLAVLLILLLLIPLCAGICLIYFAATAVSTQLSMLLGGMLLTILSILGIWKVAKWCKQSS